VHSSFLKKIKQKSKNPQGQLLIELLMTIGLSALLLPILFLSLISSRDDRVREQKQTEAVNILKETEESVRNIKNTGWSNLPSSGTYHPEISGTTWTLATGSAILGDFTQSVVISDVYRDASNNIVDYPSGTLDTSTKKIDSTVSWTTPLPQSISSTLYLTRLENTSSIDTTQTQFSLGSSSYASVASQSGTTVLDDGQVQLTSVSGRGGGNWCDPGAFVVGTYDLSNQGIPVSISATSSASFDVAFTTTGGNASGHPVDGISISHDDPPIVTNPSIYNSGKGYGVYVSDDAQYVYVNDDHYGVMILNASDLTQVGEFQISNGCKSNDVCQSIDVVGNVGYTTFNHRLYIFDAGPPFNGLNTSQNQLGYKSISGSDDMLKVQVRGNNAYVATTNTSTQFMIFDVSDPANIPNPTTINLGNGQPGVDLYVDENEEYAYILTEYSSGQDNYFIYNLTTSQIVAQGETLNNITPTAIAVIEGDPVFVIITGSGYSGNLYQVYRFYKPNTVNYCNISILNLPGVTSINAVSTVTQDNGNAYSYILTNNTSAEFQIIAGGTLGEYFETGTFESRYFDTITDVAFNSFTATASQPATTTLKLQVASATPQSGQDCSNTSYTFVGPNGTPSDYFYVNGDIISGIIPRNDISPYFTNPGRCFKYRLEFDTLDVFETPIFYDLFVNYSN